VGRCSIDVDAWLRRACPFLPRMVRHDRTETLAGVIGGPLAINDAQFAVNVREIDENALRRRLIMSRIEGGPTI